jgi:hypothetical protein
VFVKGRQLTVSKSERGTVLYSLDRTVAVLAQCDIENNIRCDSVSIVNLIIVFGFFVSVEVYYNVEHPTFRVGMFYIHSGINWVERMFVFCEMFCKIFDYLVKSVQKIQI